MSFKYSRSSVRALLRSIRDGRAVLSHERSALVDAMTIIDRGFSVDELQTLAVVFLSNRFAIRRLVEAMNQRRRSWMTSHVVQHRPHDRECQAVLGTQSFS